MSAGDNNFSAKKTRVQMLMVIAVHALVALPLVELMIVYMMSGGFLSILHNLGLVISLLIIVGILSSLSVPGLALLHYSIKDLTDFLDDDSQRDDESANQYHERLLQALNCSYQFPVWACFFNMAIWTAVTVLNISMAWIFLFQVPLRLCLLLIMVVGCAAAMVTSFQFLAFKRALLPIQKHLLSLHPDYWKEPSFQEVQLGLRFKMMYSVLSLTLVMVFLLGFLNTVDAAKALYFQWGVSQKTRIMRELAMHEVTPDNTSTKEQRAQLIESIDDHSGVKFFLFDQEGNRLLAGSEDEAPSAALSKIVALANSTDTDRDPLKVTLHQGSLIVPFSGDPDISFNFERKTVGFNAVIPVPDTDLVIVARTDYLFYISLIYGMIAGVCVITTFAIILGFIFAGMASRDLVKPLGEILEVVKKLGQGEMVMEVDPLSNDEVGVLVVNVKAMVENLRSMMVNIKTSSASVDQATSKIVEGFSKVSEGSVKQANALDITSETMVEINSSIKGIGENIETLESNAIDSSSSITQMSVSIKEIAQSADELSGIAEETTSSITEMATSIKQVAQNVEGLSRKGEDAVTSVTKMEESIKQIQEAAKETAVMSGVVATNAEEGKSTVQSTIEGIGRARKSSESAVEVISDLAQKAQEIGNILTVINDIADQTNLLALNATIIAAQSGEHGRGFAVVAEEIKALSKRTSKSTDEINQLISTVQGGAIEAVEAVQNGYREVEEGVVLSQKAGEALESILLSANKSTARTHKIAEATVEQANRIRALLQFFEEISGDISQLEGAANEQSLGTAQIMKNSEQIRTITQKVKMATEQQYTGSKMMIKTIENTTQIISFINTNQQEQILNTDRIVEEITNIRQVAGENEKSSGEMFEAASNISHLAEELREMVAFFKAGD